MECYVCDLAFKFFLYVALETVLEVVGDRPQKLEWPDHGFYLEVPDGALYPGEAVNVTVRVVSADRFQLPENSQLISALYSITSTKKLLKEVTVHIQHCAVIAPHGFKVQEPDTQSSAIAQSFAVISLEEHSKWKHILPRSAQPYCFKEPDTKSSAVIRSEEKHSNLMCTMPKSTRPYSFRGKEPVTQTYAIIRSEEKCSKLMCPKPHPYYCKDREPDTQSQSNAINSSEEEFKFIVAEQCQNCRFEEREGIFSPDTQYGTIKLELFDSLIALTAPPSTEIRCTSFLFYQPIPNTDDVNFQFVVVRKLDYLDKVCV